MSVRSTMSGTLTAPMPNLRRLLLVASCLCGMARTVELVAPPPAAASDLTQWSSLPATARPAERSADAATLQTAEWTYLVAPQDSSHVELAATITIESPATQFNFFGSSWSAWPDPKFEDRGFEAGVLLRAAEDGSRGYRVQFSTKYQEVALLRFPDSGYVRSVACPIPTRQPIKLRVTAAGRVIRVFVNDKEVLHYVDRLDPALDKGRIAIGSSSGARVTYSNVTFREIAAESTPAPQPHSLRLSSRPWLGGRLFVFDDDEPILQLHHEQDPSVFARLRPGHKPQLTFDSHWGLENQGAYREAASTWTAPKVTGGGDTLRATWSARHVKERFVTRSSLVVGYDSRRDTYTYDVDSELEMLPGEPFLFRYGFDFEHHTPLDPFRWQYLLIRDREGRMTYRPLAPFDPGPLDDIESYQGLRVWHGRTGDVHRVSPAVEYRIQPEWVQTVDDKGQPSRRKLNTAVCAAFYDTGVSFEPVTAKPGDKVRVQYRYTGYPADETAAIYSQARVQDNARIDPQHQFVFVRDQWPMIRFADSLTMDKPWWGGRPFLSGHNARPTYDVVQVDGQSLLRLGPVSYGVAPIGPERMAPGRYLVSARIKSVNTHGPGGRIELLSLKKGDPVGNGYVRMDSSNILSEQVRYFGNGSFDWREVHFVVEVPASATGLALGLGNAGTGEVFVSQVRIEPMGDKPPPVAPVTELHATPPPVKPLVKDAIWDLRMDERAGFYVYNYGASGHRTLELANIDWAEDEGISALRFRENPVGRADFPKLGILDLNLRHPVYGKNYQPVGHGAYAMGGHHGGGQAVAGLTLAAWIKPAEEMGKSHHGGKGDILGYGARRFILGLHGQSAPYALAARLNVNDRVESKPVLVANRWYHVAMTCQPQDQQWRVRLFVDGEQVAEGPSKSVATNAAIPDSLILGAELFYLHDAYYRGLIGPALVVGRTLAADEVRTLAMRRPVSARSSPSGRDASPSRLVRR